MNNNITLNASMRNNLLSLRNISKQMDKTQLVLATGKEVNSAIDNASSYYQARSLTNRAADLTALLDAMGQGIQTIEAATQGLTSGAEFLEQATAVVNKAASNVKYDFSDYTRVSTVEELKAAIADSNIDKIVVTQSLTFADNETITLTKGKTLAGLTQDVSLNFTRTDNTNKTYSMLTVQDGCTLQNITVNLNSLSVYSSNCVSISNSTVNFDNININTTGDRANAVYLSKSNASGNLNATTNGYVAIGINVVSSVFSGTTNIKTFGNGSGMWLNASSFVGECNISTIGGGAHCAQITSSSIAGVFNLEAKGGGAAGINFVKDCTISAYIYAISKFGAAIKFSDPTSVVSINTEFYLANKNAVAMSHWVARQTVTVPTITNGDYDQFMTKKEDSKNSADFVSTLEKQLEEAFEVKENNYAEQYKKILEEYDNLLNDSSYQGINLLKGGNLEVTFNESRSNKYSIAGVLADSMSLGLETRDLFDTSAIKKSLEEITKAVNSIRSFQEELGNHYSIIKTRLNFTEALTDVLETGADNLTLADMNEASAQYLTLQTRQQLAINSLSLASQSAQSILSTF